MDERIPEVLAPAGDGEALEAALAAGADAVYLGLREGFNARSRAANFGLEELPGAVARAHRGGARVYLALNTLVFDAELERLEALLRGALAAGVDALIVQDLAVARLARALSPALPLHGSTQMTLSSPAALEAAAALGLRRVILPRELPLAEVRELAAHSPLELEVFVHGALCISWSGQCQASLALAGRSANRGLCAQPCRQPYQPVLDGEAASPGRPCHPLSPRDLAAHSLIPELARLGVAAFKIEGRGKGPGYVAAAVASVRAALDGAPAGEVARLLTEAQAAYSRGLTSGFLAGADHQALVDGGAPGHLGAYLGRVAELCGQEVRVLREKPPLGRSPTPPWLPPGVVPGAGVMIEDLAPKGAGGEVARVEERGDLLALTFVRPGLDVSRVRRGARVFLAALPGQAVRLRELLARGPVPRPARRARTWRLEAGPVLPGLVAGARAGLPALAAGDAPALSVLCRSARQLQAALAAGAAEVVLEPPVSGEGLEALCRQARELGLRVRLASPRVDRPGEPLAPLLALHPDGLLVRSLGGLHAFARAGAEAPADWVGDASLQAANSLAAAWLLGRGLQAVTPAPELGPDELLALAAAIGPARLEVVAAQHLVLFHTEHCPFARLASTGRDARECGRPCLRRRLALEDAQGARHPLVAESGCRVSVRQARLTQLAPEALTRLRRAGVRRFRVELLDEGRGEALEVLARLARALSA
ncbi:MAG TPA: U32 family peptidase [Myxococcota bacterium]|nr:U32 family peptidase [Myxococcota bacterium]HRY94174.1 U32 family peptidase [Myxococcota bacterium]HSA20498.1 U32 family peptidase [Myxococcota bacterium]